MSDSFDVVFIGSGPAGYVGAIKAAQLGLKTACVEKDPACGGTCLNVGCIPSKALLHTSDFYHLIQKEAPEMGIEIKEASFNLTKIMSHKDEIVKKLTGGIQYLFKKNKVTHLKGHARITSDTTLDVGGKQITAKHIVLATGSEPIALPNLPFDEEKIVSSTGALSLKSVPEKLLIVGGGVIGLELGSVYQSLGSKVEVIEFMDRILPEFDEDLAKAFQKILEERGFTFHFGAKVLGGSKDERGVTLEVEKGGKKETFGGNVALVSIGRRPFTKDLGLESVGIKKTDRGFVEIDNNFRTSKGNIFAVGDVAGQPMLAHKGSHEAICVAHLIAGHHHPFDYAAVPNVVYTNPEIASVGFTEKQLKEKGVEYKKSNFSLVGNSRYNANGGKEAAFVKALCHKTTGQILGCHILAPNASELIPIPTIAIQHRLTAQDMVATCFPHPTLSEALHEAFLGLTKEGFIHL